MFKVLVWTERLVIFLFPLWAWGISGREGSLAWSMSLGPLFIAWYD